MRDWQGANAPMVPDTLEGMESYLPTLRRDIGHIDYFLRDISRGMSRIQNGLVPDGSGNPIGDQTLSDIYWVLQGRINGQTGYGGTRANGTATIASTRHDTKGFVYLGSADGVAFDETNTLVGINAAIPAARLDMEVPAPSGQTPSITLLSESSIGWAPVGAATLLDALNDTSNSDYASFSEQGFSDSLTMRYQAVTDPTVRAGFSIRVSAAGMFSQAFSDILFTISNLSGGPTIATFRLNSPTNTDTSGTYLATLTGSMVEYTKTLTAGEANTIDFGSQLVVSMQARPVLTSSGTEYYRVGYVRFSAPAVGGGSATTLQRWSTSTYTDLLDFNDDGTGTGTLDLALSGDAPFRVDSGGGSSGLRLLTSSTNGRLEVGTPAQANMNLVLSGARASQGTLATLDFLNTTLSGTVTIAGGGPIAGDVLTAVDATGLATWGTGTATAGTWAYVAVTTTYSVLTTDTVVDCTSGTFTVTLPTAVGVTGKIYDIKNSGSGVITVATTSSQTIDGGTTATMRRSQESITLISNGANWEIV